MRRTITDKPLRRTSDTSAARIAEAFNAGSDARINGYELSDNPNVGFGSIREAWSAGWLDVQKFWGAAAKRGRHHVRRLPLLDAEFTAEGE